MHILLIATVLCFGHSFCFGMDTATSTATQKTCSPKSLLKQCIKFLAQNHTVAIKSLRADELQNKILDKSERLVMKESKDDPEQALFLAIEKDYHLIIERLVGKTREKLAVSLNAENLPDAIKEKKIATLDIRNKKGKTPLGEAIIKNNPNVVQQLIKLGAVACTEPFALAALYADDNMITLLGDKNLVDIYPKNTTFTAFMIAVFTMNIPICKALLNIPSMNIFFVTSSGESALTLAIEHAKAYNKPDDLRSFFELLEVRSEWVANHETLLKDALAYKKNSKKPDFSFDPLPTKYPEKNNNEEIATIIKEYRAYPRIVKYIMGAQKHAPILQVSSIKIPGILVYNSSTKHGVTSLDKTID